LFYLITSNPTLINLYNRKFKEGIKEKQDLKAVEKKVEELTK